jgi:Glycosyl hydrolases family 16
MSALTDLLRGRSGRARQPRRKTRIITLSAATAGVMLLAVLVTTASGTHSPSPRHRTIVTVAATKPEGTPYPLGSRDRSEPSGMAPPGKNALPGYSQTYENDFKGAKLPAGWEKYSGMPGGDPGAQWGLAHVVVAKGMLQLKTYQDPAYGGEWVTGGVCQCGHSQTYGAYFVRSRVTGAGPTNVELLWPVAPVWPPEIDFNETGGATVGTSATVHWGAATNQDQRADQTVVMTQWHTWGVIWTPTSITYTLDGRVWGKVTVASEIPDQAMTLDLQQQASCVAGYGYACPTAPESMLIDWVAEYAPR